MARDQLPLGDLIKLSDRDEQLDILQEQQESGKAPVDGLHAFTAGIKRENYTSRFVNQQINVAFYGAGRTYIPDPDYRPEDDPANIGYDPSVLLDARNANEAADLRFEIDMEYANLRLISQSNWGLAGQVFGGIFQPHVVAGMVFAPAGIPALVAGEAGLEAGSEVLLHNMQKTRTMQESYMNVGLTAMGVGILGGAAKMFARGDMPDIANDVIADINAGRLPSNELDSDGLVPAEAVNDSVSSARVIDSDPMTMEDDALIGGRMADMFSIGQMSRLANSVSNTARDVAGKMADNPLFNKGHAAGRTRGVTVESFHEASMGRVVVATDKAGRLQRESPLNPIDFDHQVGVAMSNGDRHTIPQVQQAAQMYREDVIGPIQEAAQKLGLLDDDLGLKIKIEGVTDDIQRLVDEGAGAGSTKAKAESEAARAGVITKSQKTTDKLQKRVDTLKAKLDAARKPGKDGKKRTAPASMRKEYNDARKALTEQRKTVQAETKDYDKRLSSLKAQKQALAKSRAELRELEARLARGGTAFAESYFPRQYDSTKIYENWDGLADMLRVHFQANPKMGDMTAEQIEDQIVETIQNMIGGKSQATKVDGTPSPLRARTLALMDNDLEHFLVKGASNQMIHYAQNMQPYILMREAFGDRSFAEMTNLIREEYKALIKADPQNAEKLGKQLGKDIGDLTVMHNRLMHQVQRSVNPRSVATRILQYSKVYNIAAMLGGIVVSSLPDIARPITHYGLRSFAKGVAKTMVQFAKGVEGMPSVQVKRTGAALQRTLNDRAQQLTDTIGGESKLSQNVQKVWAKWSGFDVYTDIMESVASHAAMDFVVRNAAKVASAQPLSKSATKQLSRMGLDEADLRGIYRESLSTGGAQDSVLKYMNTMAWKDSDLAKRAEAAIGSDVRRTIIRLGIGDKPSFMDETTWSWLFQFQSFAMGAQNKIMVAGFQNMNRHTAEGLVAMMALGAGVGATKATLRGQDVSDWSVEQWLFEGIDRSGMAGILREPMNILRYFGATSGLTDGIPSRYAGLGLQRVITPPAAAIAGNLGKAFYAGVEGEGEKALEHLSRATPFVNNTWHIREVLMRLGEQ